jgi:hypothetical protein
MEKLIVIWPVANTLEKNGFELDFWTKFYTDYMGMQMGRTTHFFGETTCFCMGNLLRGVTTVP